MHQNDPWFCPEMAQIGWHRWWSRSVRALAIIQDVLILVFLGKHPMVLVATPCYPLVSHGFRRCSLKAGAQYADDPIPTERSARSCGALVCPAPAPVRKLLRNQSLKKTGIGWSMTPVIKIQTYIIKSYQICRIFFINAILWFLGKNWTFCKRFQQQRNPVHMTLNDFNKPWQILLNLWTWETSRHQQGRIDKVQDL